MKKQHLRRFLGVREVASGGPSRSLPSFLWVKRVNKRETPPGFFVSVAFKGFSRAVSCLESILARMLPSVDSKGDGKCLGSRAQASCVGAVCAEVGTRSTRRSR